MNDMDVTATIDVFARALQARGGFETVTRQVGPNQVRLLGRVRNQASPSWILVVTQLLVAQGQTDAWSVDISKQYFLRGGKLMFGWRVIVQGTDVVQHLPAITKVVASSPRARAIVDEQALPGVRGDRNAPSASNKGKGAQSALRATVGPMALASITRS